MKQLLAYAMFTGGVIGVGVFGLPYVLVRAGVLPTLLQGFLVLLVVWVTHLLFADVVLRTKGKKRFPGIVGTYLGTPGWIFAIFGNVLGLVGAQLAYLIAGGAFLALLLQPVFEIPPLIATLLYFTVGAVVLVRGVKQLPWIQFVIIALFGVTLVAIGAGTAAVFRWEQLPLVGPLQNHPLPYGVLLFAFWGLALIPELVEMTGRRWQGARRVLGWGLLTAVVSYAVFAVLVGGVSGSGTSEDALQGLTSSVGNGVVFFGAFFGVLTTFSSFLAIGLTFQRTLSYDFRMRPPLSWVLSLGAPLTLYLLGIQTFVHVLGVTGAVFLGIEGLLVILTFWASRPARFGHLRLLDSPVLLSALALLLLAGVGLEILKALGVA